MTTAPVRAAAVAIVAAGLFVILALPTNGADAAPGSRPPVLVVLFTPPTHDPLVARIEAELAAVHIAVRILDVPPDSEIDAVVTGEISSGASAAIRVLPRSSGAEVWTKDTTAQVLRRRSISGADTSDAATSVVAWRTVEFLRASLLDLGKRPGAGSALSKSPTEQASSREATPINEKTVPTAKPAAPAPRADGVQSTPAISTPTPTPTPTPTSTPTSTSIQTTTPTSMPTSASVPRFAIAAGPAFVGSFGGIAPIASGVITGQARISGRTGVEVMAMFPISLSRLTTPEGSVEVGASLFGAAADFRLTPPGPWVADCALGGSAFLFRTVGTGVGFLDVNPNQGSTDSTWRFAAYARLGAGVEITPWLILRADGIAGASPRIVVNYSVDSSNPNQAVSRVLASWGPVFAAATMAVQAAW